MTEGKKTGLDIFGVQGFSNSAKIATEKPFDGAAAFLSRVCLPAAEEFGLLLRDRVSAWRGRVLRRQAVWLTCREVCWWAERMSVNDWTP